MQLIRSVLIVCILVLVVNIAFAQEENSNETSFQDILPQATLKQSRYFYLLGSIGYNSDFDAGGLGYSSGGHGSSGFAINAIGGWQGNNFFAVEVGLGYNQAFFYAIDLKALALFQPNMKINNTITIIPRIGFGLSYIHRIGITPDYHQSYYYQEGTYYRSWAGILGTLGVRVNFGRFIAGVSYENNFLGGFLEYTILSEFGIRF